MILILQVMMKIIYTLEFQKVILTSQLTQPYKKIVLLLKNQNLTLHKKVLVQ